MYCAHKNFQIIWLSNLLPLSITEEGYARNASCALNWIYTFFFPLKRIEKFHFMQSSVEIAYIFSHNLFKLQCCNNRWILYLLESYLLILWGLNIYKLFENYSKIRCPFQYSSYPSIISIKKVWKRIIVESNRKCAKGEFWLRPLS